MLMVFVNATMYALHMKCLPVVFGMVVQSTIVPGIKIQSMIYHVLFRQFKEKFDALRLMYKLCVRAM